RDSKTRELRLIADTGEHQNLWSLNRSRRKHDFTRCLDRPHLVAPIELDAGDRHAVDRELSDLGSRQDGDIGLVIDGIQIVGLDVQLSAAANTNVRQSAARAFLKDSVLIRKNPIPDRLRCGEEGRRQANQKIKICSKLEERAEKK